MTPSVLTPLLGREFDNFLFASVSEDRNGPLLSVVSALAQLDIDPWKEAASLARMPKQLAMGRLTSLIASLPTGSTAGSAPETIAARLTALLPEAAVFNAPSPASLLKAAAPAGRSRLVVVFGLLVLLLAGYLVLTPRASNAPQGAADAPAATGELTARH